VSEVPLNEDRGSTRREFARALLLAAAAPLVASGTPAHAADPPKPPKTEEVAEPARALAEVVRFRHGKQLSPEQLAAVERGITGTLATADRLRQFPLKNSDEPAFAFTADVP
jgi:hypothetical protein